jgi:hypothetical protein
MPKSTLTRRALVASTAAVPAAAALGLPAVAQAVVEPDRIFAAIEQFKSGVAALVSGYDGPRHDAFEEAFFKVQAALLETVPTTLVGMKAKISFCMDDRTLSECVRASAHDFLNTLYKSACLMVGVS